MKSRASLPLNQLVSMVIDGVDADADADVINAMMKVMMSLSRH